MLQCPLAWAPSLYVWAFLRSRRQLIQLMFAEEVCRSGPAGYVGAGGRSKIDVK